MQGITLESLAPQERRADRYVAAFTDGTEITVNAAQIADFGLYSGRELQPEELEELRGALELNSAKTRALRILGSRNLSAREIEKRLTERGISDLSAKMTVEWLEEVGAINDVEYASSIVNYYATKGYGPARIRDELYKRGIPRDLSDAAMNGAGADKEAAYDFIKKKLGDSREEIDIRKVTQALYRRGFAFEDAISAVRDYIKSSDD